MWFTGSRYRWTRKLWWKAGRKKRRAETGFAWERFATPRATCWRGARRGLWGSTRNTLSGFAPRNKKIEGFPNFSEEKEHASKETKRQRQRSWRQGQGFERMAGE